MVEVAQLINGSLIREMDTVTQGISDTIDRLGMRTTGQTQASLRNEITVEGNTIVARVFGEESIGALEYGRRAGGMPPVSVIQQWVVDKGIASGKEALSLGWAISKKIEAEGTSWLQKAPTGVLSDNINEEVYRRIAGELFLEIVDDIKSEVLREFRNP